MTRYAVYCRDEDGRRGDYAAKDPATGAFVERKSFGEGWRTAPAKLEKLQAVELARQLLEETGRPWYIELAPEPCPSCSRDIWADDRDFCYPLTRDLKRYRAGCNEHDGGCGHEVEGTSFEDVMQAWNRRPAGPFPL
jgi:hypothetical protein